MKNSTSTNRMFASVKNLAYIVCVVGISRLSSVAAIPTRTDGLFVFDTLPTPSQFAPLRVVPSANNLRSLPPKPLSVNNIDVSNNCASTAPIPTGCTRIVTASNEPYNFSNSEPTLPGSSDAFPFWTFSSGSFTVRPCTDENNATDFSTTSPFFRFPTSDIFYTPENLGVEYATEKGWVLAFKDFGVRNSDGSGKGPSVPFFALYNKYMGKLRVFAYNPATGHFTRNYLGFRLKQWKLNGSQTLKRSALLSHGTTDPNYLFYDAYNNVLSDCNPVAPAAVSTTQTDGWVFADFDLTGYDPDTSETMFEVSISDFEQANFSGSFSGALSGSGTFTGELSGGGGGGTLDNWGSTLSGVTSSIKGINSFASATAVPISASAIIGFLAGDASPIGVIGTALSLANTLVSLFQENQPQTITGTLSFTGKLNGSIAGTVNAAGTYSRAIYLGVGSNLPYDQQEGLHRPLNDISWGIYTLQRPTHSLSFTQDSFNDYYYPADGLYYRSTQATIQTPISLVLNPNLDMTLINTEISYVYQDQNGSTVTPATGFVPVGSPATVVNVLRSQDYYYDEYGYINYRFLDLIYPTPNAYIIRLTFRTPSGLISRITKLYPLPDDINQQLNDYLQGGYSSARKAASEEVTNSIKVYPNPIDQSATIDIHAVKAGSAEYKVTDLTGKTIYSEKLQVTLGKQKIIWNGNNHNGTKIPAGIYLLEMNMPGQNGPEHLVQKILKQ